MVARVVSVIISWVTSRTSPSRQDAAFSSAARANTAPYPGIRVGWNDGWHSRRCRRCRVYEQVDRPSPMTSRIRS